jgi:hypothetical protein
MIFTTTALLLALTPAPELAAGAPPALPVAVSLDLETIWRLDGGYRVFSDRRAASRGGASLSYDVTRGPGPRLALALGYHGESETGSFAGLGEAGLTVGSGSLSALLRWPLSSWLEPHLRLAADLSRANLTIDAGSMSMADADWSAGASAGAGVRLRSGTTRIWSMPGNGLFALALIVEGGFHVGQPLSLELRRQNPSSDRITPATTPVGQLGRSHPYLRLSLALVF